VPPLTRPRGGPPAAPAIAAGAVALRRDAARDLLLAGVLVAAGAAAVGHGGGFGIDYALKALLIFAAGATLVWVALPATHPHPRFGAANRLTLARFALSCGLAALVGESFAQPDAVAWVVVVTATVTAVLDAADGPLARRSGLASDFGARFDMETDAWLTLVLCALVVQFDKAGAWVLASGLMRHAFVAAARRWPWLAAPLPPSRRRQAVCVVQITTLIVCLGPVVPRWAASALAAIALAALTLSFAVDVRWLARARRLTTETAA